MKHILAINLNGKPSSARFGWSEVVRRSDVTRKRSFKVASYGIFSHPEGVHRFLHINANTMVNNFNCVSSKILHSLCPVPVYLQHNNKLTTIGKVINIKATHSGLNVQLDLPADKLPSKLKTIRATPLWQTSRVKDTYIQPCTLLSVVLTDPEEIIDHNNRPILITNLLPKQQKEPLTPQLNNSKKTNVQEVHDLMDKSGLSYIQSWKKINQ